MAVVAVVVLVVHESHKTGQVPRKASPAIGSWHWSAVNATQDPGSCLPLHVLRVVVDTVVVIVVVVEVEDVVVGGKQLLHLTGHVFEISCNTMQRLAGSSSQISGSTMPLHLARVVTVVVVTVVAEVVVTVDVVIVELEVLVVGTQVPHVAGHAAAITTFRHCDAVKSMQLPSSGMPLHCARVVVDGVPGTVVTIVVVVVVAGKVVVHKLH